MGRRGQEGAVPAIGDPAGTGRTRRAQVYKACLEAILDGRLWPGARLPAARKLAREWAAARNTIDEALMQLQAEGFLERRVGDGTYVADPLPGRFARARPQAMRPASRVGQLAMESASAWARMTAESHVPGRAPRPRAFLAGFPALECFPLGLWQRLTARNLREPGRRLLGYFPSMGHEPLREATARHLALARGVACAPEQVMILNSAIQGLDLIGRVLLDRGDGAWIEQGGYPNVRAALSGPGAQVVAVPTDDEGLQVAGSAPRAPRPALVHACPACHYATGVRMSLARRVALLRWAEGAGAWIVENDYQGEFSYDGRAVETLHALDRGMRVFHLGTFTNALFPSLRLAYLVIPPPLVAVFQAVRAQLDDHTHGIDQAVLADFIDGGHFSAHLRRMKPIYQERRDALVASCARHLPQARLGPAVAGMSVALHLPPSSPDVRIAERGWKAGMPLAPLSRFAEGARLNGLLLGYTALHPEEIRAGVQRLGRLLREP